jgi:predicted transposase/invertase (TIGR01784 family)
MKRKIQNQHDKIIKETFSRPQIAKEYFKKFLPEDLKSVINFDSMIKLDSLYIQEGLDEYFADLVFQFKVKGSNKPLEVSLLFEHKAHPDKYVYIQLGHYIFSQWVKEIKDKVELIPIIPFIYYQSKKQWKVPTIHDLFKEYPESIKKYIPTFDFVFMALNALSEETLDSITNTMLYIALTGHNRKVGVKEFIHKLNNILKLKRIDDIDRNFISLIFVYKMIEEPILQKEQFIELTKSIPNPINKDIMSLYDSIKIEGKIEGEQVGIQKEKIETILLLNKDKIPVDQIARYVRLSVEEVNKILKEKSQI